MNATRRQVLSKIVALLFLISCSSHVQNEFIISGKVIGIIDGDTIDILYNGKKLGVRLAHVDCPEKNQPFGNTARKFTSDKCFGQTVTIENDGKYYRNKRLIGIVINEQGENVNKELVKAGLAWHYLKYSSDSEYSKIESAARNDKNGLWVDLNPTPPWKWRKK